ncbi:MAG: ATP-dependent RecD-like DNA helicase [Oscillospiraceae bacterium]|nr:ATP-dependent RecD-like DNA helicase [Oscillospiraceae bacterium]
MEEFEEKLKLHGTVTDITFHNDTNGYTVFSVDTGKEELTVVGTIADVKLGDRVEIIGDFTYHSVYGRQFKADVCTAMLPETVDDLYRYLASGAIKGIGPAMAMKIVEKFGENSFDILEREPERLAEIKGISLERAKKIGAEYNRQYSTRLLMMNLSRYGLKTGECIFAFERLGSNATEIIEENPYVLCEGEGGISFERAEQIADMLPKKPVSKYRIEAGVLYVIRHNFKNGHTCVPLEKVYTPSGELLDESRESIEIAVDNLCDGKKVIIEKLGDRDFIFLPESYRAEKSISDRIKILLKYPPENPINVDGYIDGIEKASNIQYAEKQKEAIKTAVNRGVLILTGGPGTGKTTTLDGIIKMFEKDNLDIALCAPTGRAAQRMTETTGRTATTIHRLLEVEWDSGDKPVFKRNLRNPLEAQAVIVDEMSMVDIFLFSSLLDALPFGCRLIMVGDSDQLPSVSAGNVLSDLIACGLLPVVQLKEIFRQSMESNIVLNAHAIVNGERIKTEYKEGDFYLLQRNFPLDAVRTVRDLYTKRLPEAYGYDPLTQIQVLCPSKKGDTGTFNLNRLLQEAVNPASPDKQEYNTGYRIFRAGDKVMQTRNNYNIHWESVYEEGDGVFNGDIGFIELIDLRRDAIVIDFSGRRATYSKEQLSEIELAYAVTVHKAQGSEFDAVIMPAISVNGKLCYRNLLYTAVTRAKKLMVLVGTEGCVNNMIDNRKTQLRYSALKHFLLDKEEKSSIM